MEKRRINSRAIIWRDGKILAVRHKDTDWAEDDHWALPGGGLDYNEFIKDAVKREVFEELGVEAEVGELIGIQQFYSQRKDFSEELELFFHVHDSPDFDKIDLSKTSHGMNEIAEVKFVDPKQTYMKPECLSTMDIAGIIAGTAPVHVENQLIKA